MAKLKLALAIFFSKLTYYVFKLCGRNASHSPGVVALKICPNYFAEIKKPPLTICVSGTNGKTTVTNMISDALELNGLKVATNRLGSNIAPGCATAVTNSVNLFGKPKCDALVLEVDERASRLILPYLKPDYLAVTNLFRDSLMRNAHPDYIFSVLNTYIPENTKLILNADDIFSSQLRPQNERVFFGISKQPTDRVDSINLVTDSSFCPKCYTKLVYNYRRYHHIGNAYCPECGFKSSESDYLVEEINSENNTLSINCKGEKITYHLINDAIYNVYNQLTMTAVLKEAGFSDEALESAYEKMSIVKTRMNENKVGDIEVFTVLSKGQNSVSVSRAFDYIASLPGKKAIIFAFDDGGYRKNSIEFSGWIYDADFEYLNNENIVQFVISGPRCYDDQLRLLMAGVDKGKITTTLNEDDAPGLLNFEGIDKIYILHDTTTVEIAQRLLKKTTNLLKEAQK